MQSPSSQFHEMLQTNSLFTLKPLTDQSPPPFAFTFFPSRLNPTFISHPPKPSRFLLRCSAVDAETLPKSAIQRIAEKLRSLGFTEEPPEPVPDPNRTSPPGEIFLPLPNRLPKYRVGHTVDSSWSTPENPVPEPGTGSAIKRFHDLRDEVEKKEAEDRMMKKKKKREERAPTLAELSLPEEELGRLGGIGIRLKKKLKIGKAGITEGIVNTIHEQWRRSEMVKIVCEDLCRLNMKRTHDLLEPSSQTPIASYRLPLPPPPSTTDSPDLPPSTFPNFASPLLDLAHWIFFSLTLSFSLTDGFACFPLIVESSLPPLRTLAGNDVSSLPPRDTRWQRSPFGFQPVSEQRNLPSRLRTTQAKTHPSSDLLPLIRWRAGIIASNLLLLQQLSFGVDFSPSFLSDISISMAASPTDELGRESRFNLPYTIDNRDSLVSP